MRVEAGLPEPERRLVDAVRTGALVDLRTGNPDVDAVSSAPAWDLDRVVRAELLVELLIGSHGSQNDQLRGVKLRGARLTGRLDLEAVSLVCPLLLQDCYLDDVVDVCEAQAPALRLRGCHVPGVLANRLYTRGDLEFCDGFKTHGGIDLVGAHIGGSLVLNGADLTGSSGDALCAARITVGGNMFCENGFRAHNTVNLIGAQINGSLTFSGAHLSNPDGVALEAARIRVEQAVFFRDRFVASGEVNIRNARIGFFVDFADASLTNANGFALQASGLTAERGLYFGKGSTVSGKVALIGARTTGRLVFRGGQFNNPNGFAIDLERVHADTVILLPGERPNGVVDLSDAQVTTFSDDPETWPASMRLRGFTYEILENDSVSVRSRLHWLTLHDGGYVPGLYDQLAATYRRAGSVEASRIVSIVKQKQRRRELNPFGRAWNLLLYATVGYGYRTWWAGLWLLALLTIGSIIFAAAYPENMVAATGVVPSFQPVAYTMDILVPLVDLGQKKTWIPRGPAMIWSWILTGSGWLLTTAVVAGLTNALKRD